VNDFGVGRFLPDVNGVGHAGVIESRDPESDDVCVIRATSETVELNFFVQSPVSRFEVHGLRTAFNFGPKKVDRKRFFIKFPKFC
jgi:hypothetical protein